MPMLISIVLAASAGIAAGFYGRARLENHQPEPLDEDAAVEWLFKQNPLPMIVSLRADGRILKANSKFADYFNLDHASIIGRTTTAIGLLSPGGRASILKRLARQAELTLDLRGDCQLECSQRYLHAVIVKARYQEQDVLLSTFLCIDDFDETVRERLLLALAMEQLNEVVIITDQRGVIKYVNPNFTPLTGMAADDAVGRFITSLAALACSDGMLNGLMQVLNRTGSWEGQHYIKDLHENSRLIQASVSRVADQTSGREHYIMVGRDITERVELERALAQAQRLEAIGTLSAGIAHDLNNALMPVMGYAELSLDEIAPDNPVREYLQIIMHSAQRCKEMVQHILRSSHPNEPQPQPVRIQSIIKETAKLLRFSLPDTIEVVHGLDEHCRPVLIDPTQIYQVIMNLGTNAYHAMRESGGNIFIYLTEIAVDTAKPPLENLKPGIYAKLAVVDSGPGIAEHIKNKIFDPFFSTRAAEGGTGMGLYITQSIVTDHGGAIIIDSQPGGGTAVNVFLPCVIDAGSEPAVDVSLHPLGGSERILIVDDEIFVAEMIRTMVSRLGYQITLAHSGTEGLAKFQANPASFDLIITDHSMPGTSGLELAEAVTRLKPQLPIIMITGYNDSFDDETLSRHGINKVLYKPIALRVIACAIREQLDRRGLAA